MQELQISFRGFGNSTFSVSFGKRSCLTLSADLEVLLWDYQFDRCQMILIALLLKCKWTEFYLLNQQHYMTQFWLHHSETTSISSASIENNLNAMVVDNKSVKKKFPSVTFSFLKNLCSNYEVEFRCTYKQIYKSVYYVIIREITNLHSRVRVEISHF